MAENLRVTHYSDGTKIPYNKYYQNGSYWWYNNDSLTFKSTYGALYDWISVNTYKLCPTGWHVPLEIEWQELITFLGGESVAGGKLKETGTTHWNSPNTGATNESGFTALPGGILLDQNDAGPNSYVTIGTKAYWWSGTRLQLASSVCEVVNLSYDSNIAINSDKKPDNAISVRCVKNSGPTVTTDPVTLTTPNAMGLMTVKSGGHIIDDNGLEITHKGLCWSNSPGYGPSTDVGGGPENFESTFTYYHNANYPLYIKAYATNAAGTGYGQEIRIDAKK
jgi:uncharacterized protein (TIGR02145 family)